MNNNSECVIELKHLASATCLQKTGFQEGQDFSSAICAIKKKLSQVLLSLSDQFFCFPVFNCVLKTLSSNLSLNLFFLDRSPRHAATYLKINFRAILSVFERAKRGLAPKLSLIFNYLPKLGTAC